MQINIHSPTNFTLESIRRLIASKDDSENRQIQVSKTGLVTLSDLTGYQQLENVDFRLESFAFGTGHVGAEAALDDFWVSRVYNALEEWRKAPHASYSDDF